MRWKQLTAWLLGALAVFAWAGVAGAGDTLRLDGRGDAKTTTLELKGGADTVPVRWGGWRRGWGGWGRGWGWAGWRRGWGWRPYWRGFGWPYYAGYYDPGFYTGLYFPRLFGLNIQIGRPVYYSAEYDDACPIVDDAGPVTGGTELRTRPRTYMLQPPRETVPPPSGAPDDATYPYDGGPQDPVPMPKGQPAPTGKPPAKGKVADGPVASLRVAKPSRFAYPAYGELAPTTSIAEHRAVLTVKHSKPQTPRP